MPKNFATVGAVQNGNSVVLVTVTAKALLDRRTVALTEGLPTHPYHHEGAWAVGRYLNTPGARTLTLTEAVALVKKVDVAAKEGARQALERLANSVSSPIGALAVRICAELPSTIEACIRDNRAQTQADAVMYRRALANAAVERGWAVHWYEVDDAEAAKRELTSILREFGKAAGVPWQATHQLAAAAALSVSKRPVTRPRAGPA